MIATGEERRWRRAAQEHGAALAAFLESARAVPAPDWDRSDAEGQWSPAEVTEHLALSYVAARRELEGGVAMSPRVSPFRQTLFRWFLLPHMLYHRSMPRVRAPRETRPGRAHRGGREQQIERLKALADEVEGLLRGRRAARLTHPYFGSISAIETLRLMALHLEHHRRHLSRTS